MGYKELANSGSGSRPPPHLLHAHLPPTVTYTQLRDAISKEACCMIVAY